MADPLNLLDLPSFDDIDVDLDETFDLLFNENLLDFWAEIREEGVD